MSEEIRVLHGTGRKGVDLFLTEFSGGDKGMMLQLTQGVAGTILCDDPDEPGFIQLTALDAIKVIEELAAWLKSIAFGEA